jgi:hypothetical protein
MLVGRIGGDELPLAVLADNALAEMFHPNLQTPTARRAFLHKISYIGHDEWKPPVTLPVTRTTNNPLCL